MLQLRHTKVGQWLAPLVSALLKSGVDFLILVGAPEDLRHESNIHSIHYFLADPHYAGARRRRSYRIRSTEVSN